MRTLKMAQSAQVLAEAVVVSMVLVILLLAVHGVGRMQYQWTKQWLAAQVAADAAVADHLHIPDAVTPHRGAIDRLRQSVMTDYGIGQSHWARFDGQGQFAQQAWRVLGSGHASADSQVRQRIEQAQLHWQSAAFASQTAARPLWLAIQAVDAPWAKRGEPLQWLRQWQGSTPEIYLETAP